MNKHNKSRLLLALITFSLATAPRIHAARYGVYAETSDSSLLWGIGIAAAGICGIAAACNALSWSDEDILKWVKNGMDDCDIQYQQLNTSHGSLVARLQLYGNRNKASWEHCVTEVDEVTYYYPHFAPLHNALLIIKGDIKKLLNYNSYLMRRNLISEPRGRNYYQKIASMTANLEQLKDTILSSHDFTQEEHALQPKIHQLRQERLARERNEALEAQARAQRDQAKAIREQTQMQREQAQRDTYKYERERERIRYEQEQLRYENERLQREQERLRREQESQRFNSREQERIRHEQEKLRNEQERIRNEQERLRRQQEQQARELQNSSRPVEITVYNDCFPILLED